MDLTATQIESLTKKRWILLIICCLINLCIGSMYAWSVLAAPMTQELNVSNLSMVFSIANAVGFIGMIIGGLVADRKGPRWVMFVGGLMFGIGMFTCGFAQSVGHLILSYGVILGIGLSLVYGCTISTSIKYFPDKRGMAGGMTTAFYGISSVVMAPIANALNSHVGVRASFKILGVVFLIVICVGSLFISTCPPGFMPSGYTPPVQTSSASSSNDKTTAQMLSMPIFYVMLIMLTCGGVFGLMVISNASSLSVNIAGVGAGTASLLVSVLCLFNTAGRLIAGSLSDKLGRINTLTVAIIIALVGLTVLYAASGNGSLPLLVIGLILVGVCFGTFMGVFPGFCTDQFGSRHNTVNYGIMWIGFSLAGIVGPTILSSVYASTGAYRMAFILSDGIALLGLILTFVYRAMNKKLV